MPDITLCADGKCPLRLQCYRYRAAPTAYQSYTATMRASTQAKKCSWHVPILQGDLLLPVQKESINASSA